MEYPKFSSTIAPEIATRLEEEATNRELTTSELVREIVTRHYEKSLAPQAGSGESMNAAKNGGDAEGRFQRHWPSGRPRRMMRKWENRVNAAVGTVNRARFATPP